MDDAWYSYIFSPVVGFISLVAIPLLGLLSALKIRVAEGLGSLVFMWTFAGLVGVLGVFIPMGPGDVITKEQIDYWANNPGMQQTRVVWAVGCAIGIGLLLTTLVFEKLSDKRVYKIIWGIFKTVVFVGSAATFVRLYLLSP